MRWEYNYDESEGKTTIYWDDTEQDTFQGKITSWKNDYPQGDAREVVAQAIQNAGTFEQIRMLYDFNYGFTEREQE